MPKPDVQKPDEHDRAADLLERLLTDPKFRAAFRRNPVAAAKKYELPDLAEEFSGKGKAMYTLEIRESRSSLAGVMMAAAAEGVDASDLSQSAGAGKLDTPASIAVNRALSRANLQAVQGPGVAGAGNGAAAALDQSGSGSAGSSLPAPAPGVEVSGATPPAAAPPGVDPAAGGQAGVEPLSPDAAGSPVAGGAGLQGGHQEFAGIDPSKLGGQGQDVQAAHDGFVQLQPAQGAQPQGAAVGAAPVQPSAPVQPGAPVQPVAPVQPGVPAQPGVPVQPAAPVQAVPPTAAVPDPQAAAPPGGAAAAVSAADQQASAAPGGAAAAVAATVPDGAAGNQVLVQAVLKDPNITLPPDAQAAFLTGSVDSRVPAMLESLSAQGHKIDVGLINADAADAASGGSGSGVGFDITAVDGKPVDASNMAARDIVEALTTSDPAIRPTTVGSPWPINDPSFFTDTGHQDHLHIGWDGPLPAGWTPPQDVVSAPGVAAAAQAASAAPAAAAAQSAVPAAPAAATAAPDPSAAAGAAPAATPVVDPSAAPVAPAAPVVPAAPVAPAAPVLPGAAVLPAPGGVESAAVGSAQAGHEGFAGLDVSQLDQSQGSAQAAHEGLVLGSVPDQAQQQAGAPAGVAQPGQPGQVAAALDPSVAAGHAPGDFLPDGSDVYPGDSASQEQIAAWMGRQAHKAGLPAELPVMASLVESGMKNVNYGDADSLGYFQMRVSVWNQGAYAGFDKDPQLQLKWFIDQALEVKKQRLADGRGAELQDPSKWGAMIADIERPAAQYRGRYQLKLNDAQTLLHDQEGAVTTPAAAQFVQPSPSPAAAVVPSATAPPMTLTPGHAGGAVGQAVAATVPVPTNVPGLQAMTIDGIHATGSPRALQAVENAFRYKGTPYYWGGNTEKTGFDCSGLMQWSYHQSGIDISRVTYTQVHDGVEVANRDNLQAGDLILFRDSSGDIHHVGMYIGDHKFIHAPHTGDVVKVSDLRESYYAQQFYMGRRIAPEGAAAAAAVPGVPGAGVAPAPVEAAVQPAAAAPAAAAAGQPAAPAGPADGPVLPSVPDGGAAQVGHEGFAGIADLKQTGPGAAPVRSTVKFMPAVAQPAPVENAAQANPAVAPPAPQQVAQQVAQPGAGAPIDPAAAVEAASTGYPGDTAPKEQIAAWMAAQAKARGLPPELPVMASLVESGLHNVNYGDADSLGYFQMRTSIWNQGDYAGFPQRPDLQVKWFLDHAVAVRDQRIARGDSAFVNDPNKWGDWIADVERPAAPYRGRYQLRLDEARGLLGGAASA